METARGVEPRAYADLHEHLDRLDRAGLLYRIDAPVNKDTEMHPLVRWQFRGGIAEKDRKAFLFTNIVDSKGRRYDIPVVIGAYAANAEIYRIGMNVPALADIAGAWERAIAHPIAPRILETGPCHEVVIEGAALQGPGNGLESLPVPISTPGFDAAPYFTATGVITKDPDTGIQNLGTYRGHLKSATRLGMMMLVNLRAGGSVHWQKWRNRNERMPVAIIVGGPPVVGFQGPQKLRLDVDELGVAGGLAGGPINLVRGRTVDLLVPAEAEIVVEGHVDPEYLEPEGPFGESHGYVALEDYNLVIEVSAITRRRDAIMTSIISQVTPSESSVVKRLAYEPLFMAHLHDHLGIAGIRRVALHEPLTNLRRFVFLQFARFTPRTEIWRALRGALTLQAAIQSCPLIRLPEDSAWVIHGAPGATLVLDGLFVSGGDVVLTGSFDSVTLNCCTFDPGTEASPGELASPPGNFALSADLRPLRPTRLWIEATITALSASRCILGPIRTRAALRVITPLPPGGTIHAPVVGTVATLSLSETIVQGLADGDDGTALRFSDGTAMLSRCTVLGPTVLHRVDVSESILRNVAQVDDTQDGCVRFSAWAAGSTLPRKYESVSIPPGAGLFTSTDFGQPGYAQLLASADASILPAPVGPGAPASRAPGAPPPTIIAGAADGSEMGCFAREKTPQKLRGLLLKFQEYMPAGLVPVPIAVT